MGCLEHILRGKSKALGDRCHCWRPSGVLRSIDGAISKMFSNSTQVQQRQQPKSRLENFSVGFYYMPPEWVMAVGKQLKIPPHNIQSELRQDITLVSEATRQLILLALFGEGMEEEQERKRAKYEELVEDLQELMELQVQGKQAAVVLDVIPSARSIKPWASWISARERLPITMWGEHRRLLDDSRCKGVTSGVSSMPPR